MKIEYLKYLILHKSNKRNLYSYNYPIINELEIWVNLNLFNLLKAEALGEFKNDDYEMNYTNSFKYICMVFFRPKYSASHTMA